MNNNNKFFLCILIFIIGAFSAKAQVQSYSGNNAMGDMISLVPGVEKYSYIINEHGDKLLTGTYTFSGKDTIQNTDVNVNTTYKLTAQTKKGKLEGTYSQSATYTGRVWRFETGWRNVNYASGFSGVFLNGEPNGTFSYVYNDGRNLAGTTTLKNKKYIGNFKHFGWGEKGRVEIQGQLTNDGKYTGKWHTVITGSTTDYVFQNSIVISKVNNEEATPTSVQALAKQYAEGKITEKKLNEQGVFLAQDELPLSDIINYMFFDKEYALEQIPAECSFAGYESPKFTYLVKLNSFTKAGFSFWINYIRQNGFNKNIEDYYSSKTCWTKPLFEEKYGAYYVHCSNAFAKEYANLHTNGDLYLSDIQMREYIQVRDSIMKTNVVPMAYLMTNKILYSFSDKDAFVGKLLYTYQTDKFSFYDYLGKDIKNTYYLFNDIEHTKKSIDDRLIYITFSQDSSCFSYEDYSYKNEIYLLDTLLAEVENVQQQYRNYQKDINTILENNDRILNLCKSNKGITKEYKAYINSIETSWVGIESIKTVENILAQQTLYEATIQKYFDLINQINENNTKIVSLSKSDGLVSKDFASFVKGQNTKWEGLETNAALEEILAKQASYEEKIKLYLSLKQQFIDNNTAIVEISKSNKIISKEYTNFVKSQNINWEGLSTNEKLEKILEQQNQYKDAINAFLSKSAQIIKNNDQISSSLKPYKQIIKAYLSYFKSADMTWKGVTPNTKLDEVIQNQEFLLSKLGSSQLNETEAEIKKVKNICLEDIISKLSK